MEEKLLGWLAKHGFPLEMRLAQKLSEREFRVTQSDYYSDFETGTPREIDLLGRLYGYFEPIKEAGIAEVELFCAIECKAASNPWIVFKQTKARHWSTDSAISSISGAQLLKLSRNSLKNSSVEGWSTDAGHGVREAFSESDRAFAAVMSALKAAEATVTAEMEKQIAFQKKYPEERNIYAALAFPVVAISSPLFEYMLEPDGTPALRQVKVSSVVSRYPRRSENAREGAVVYIVTEEAWPQFMDGAIEYLDLAKPSLPALFSTGKINAESRGRAGLENT